MYNSELDTFLAVVEAGSFSQAAQKLYISTSAVVQQMNLLESRLNVQLFVRSTHGVKLTSAGIELKRWSKRIIADCQEAEQALSKYQQTLVFASGYLNGQTLSSHLLPLFQKSHPDLQIYFMEISDYQQIPPEVDLLEMAYAKEPLNEQDFSFIPCTVSPLVAVLPADHPLVKKGRLTLPDLAGQELEIVAPTVTGSEERMLNDLLSVHPAIKLHYYQIFNKAVINQAQLSGHLLLIPQAYSALCSPYVTKKIVWDYTVPYGFYCRKSSNQLVHKFIDFAQKGNYTH